MDLRLRSASVKPLTSVRILSGRFVETMVKRIEACAIWKRSRVGSDKESKSNKKDGALHVQSLCAPLTKIVFWMPKEKLRVDVLISAPAWVSLFVEAMAERTKMSAKVEESHARRKKDSSSKLGPADWWSFLAH